MNFEPQKIFIGLVDFFSILMPGAMLAYFGKDWFAFSFSSSGKSFPLDGAEAGIVLIFASYLLGHFAFLFSSLLDHWVYDPLREATDWGQISKRLAKGDRLSARRLRKLATGNLLFGKDADKAVIQAERIKARTFHGLAARDAINAYQWSKARLTVDLPGGLLAVQRFEADSKFFRSLVVVLVALTLFYACRFDWWPATVCLAGTLPALWRYIDQRFKATQQAYWFVIALEASKADPAAPLAAAQRHDGLTHAGGIVYRRTENNKVEVMLIEARKDRSQRVLPKGHIEPGEDPPATAVREVKEETGCWARVLRWLEDRPLNNGPGAPIVRWYLLELCEESAPSEDRKGSWFSLAEAQGATFPETKELLACAGKLDLLRDS